MVYPKKIMSITELVALGFSRDELKRYTRISSCPATKTYGGGKWLFDTEKFEEWRNKRK